MAQVRQSAAALAERLGLDPAVVPRLEEALTHPSAPGHLPSNQRLEFLGDRVLGLTIAERLLTHYPDEAEGQLAPRLNELVRKETCAAVAREIDLGVHMRLGRSEAAAGGRRRMALLADAMEAVIAAIYLELGAEAARAFVLRHWAGRIEALSAIPRDAKTAVQEWAQARGLPTPAYRLCDRSGPDHAPRFEIEITLANGRNARGEGSTKRTAEQAAAAALLSALEAS